MRGNRRQILKKPLDIVIETTWYILKETTAIERSNDFVRATCK